MKPGGFFDFTFDRTEGAEHHVLREDFYYRTETLVALARQHGLTGQFMKDWEELPHPQSKLRISRPGELRANAIGTGTRNTHPVDRDQAATPRLGERLTCCAGLPEHAMHEMGDVGGRAS
jgi:hypothetical protein